jgi:Protein of unknown function (DUF4013)
MTELPGSSKGVDIGRAVQHAFEDQEWPKKVGIAVLISLVPVLQLAVNGWMLQITRNNHAGQELPLPDWNDIGKKFTDGIKLFVAQLVYALPMLLLGCVATLASGGLAAVAGDGTGGGAEAAFAGATVLLLSMSCVAIVYGLFLAYLSPAITIQYAKTGDIGATLRFGEVLAIARKNSGQYLMMILVLIGVGLLAGVVATIPFIGWIIGLAAAAVLAVVLGHMVGNYWRSNNI